MTPIPLLALALALVGAVCLMLLIWNRRWLELAIVLLAGCALTIYLGHGRRGPDRIGRIVAEGVNADRSISLHIRVEPGTPVWCTSAYVVESAPGGEPARDSADWRVDLHPTERSDAKPLDADAAGRAVVTLPAPLVESAPNRAVHIWFNGADEGTTRLDPSAESEPHAEPAENAEPKPHAETAEDASADSPLASALANGDWLPLVVESVSIDVTAPRELRKNWVVSFASGIKARIHSPVKTFGVSADELPGKRFNVRFADCAAATNALHGTVYAGELEVHPSQNPDIPPTNAPAAVPPFRLPGVRVGMTWDEFAAVRTNATLSAGKDAPRVQAGEPKESACEVLEGDFPFAVYSFSGDADGNALEEIVFFAKGGIDPEATIRAAVDCLGEPDVGKTVACQGTIVDVLVWRDGRTLSVLLASVASEFGDEDDPSAGTEFRVCLDSERFRERFGVLDPSVRGTRSNPYPYLPKLPTTGEVVQYVHCRRGEPWEDIDRKTGEAVLSLVSDYRGYRRVNSKEPSFQRAWREGFVDLLLRGNDDVRHLTFSSDGAWLDVGDGYCYLSVPEEKRPELLKLLEPFERQTTSADAPSVSEAHAEGAEN